MEVFGPVPSRRLGRSLGLNNIPPKVCTYSCVYCQLGRTTRMASSRRCFAPPEGLVVNVAGKLAAARARGERVDYLAFVPDGEPTLDLNFGQAIDMLRPLGVPVAIISNASLIGREDVRSDLAKADWVSLKVDSLCEGTWRRIDRPHGRLKLSTVLEGMLEFAKMFPGQLVTETMLVGGLNDGEEQVAEVADFLARLEPAVAYLSVPTRPPAEAWALPPSPDALRRAQAILATSGRRIECLTGYEGNAFASTGDAAEDLLAILAVHPMREDAVRLFLERVGAEEGLLGALQRQGQVIESTYAGVKFYRRKLG
ncbi:MAG: radical SAM protein [Chloroflexi bacterium]|nr:radical SAM protein [Chloroflexota bacterium]